MPHGSKKWCNNGVIQHTRMAGQQLGSARRIGFIASKYLWRSDRVHMTAMASRTAAFSDGCHAGRSWYPWYRKHQAWRTFKHKMKIFEHVQHMFSTTIHVGSCWILLENLGICWGRANSWHLNPKLCGLSESSKILGLRCLGCHYATWKNKVSSLCLHWFTLGPALRFSSFPTGRIWFELIRPVPSNQTFSATTCQNNLKQARPWFDDLGRQQYFKTLMWIRLRFGHF